MCQKCRKEAETKISTVLFDDIPVEMDLCEECDREFALEDAMKQKKAAQMEMAKKIVAMMELGGEVNVHFHFVDPRTAEELAATLHQQFNKPYVKREYDAYDSYTTSLDHHDDIGIFVYTTNYKGDSSERTA